MDSLGRVVLAITSAILGLSLVAVLLSQKAQTANVINAASTGLSGLISAADKPITG